MSPRSRRALLASVATGVSVLAGCSDTDRAPPTATSTNSLTETVTSTDPPATTSTDSPTGTPNEEPCVDGGETRYRLGEYHEVSFWRLTVSSLELLTTLETDDGTIYELPDDKQVALVTLGLKNTTDDTVVWSNGNNWGFITAPCTFYRPQVDVYEDSPKSQLDGDELQQVEHVRQYAPDGQPFDAGERGEAWELTVLPRDVPRDQLEIGFRWSDTQFPIRWIPR